MLRKLEPKVKHVGWDTPCTNPTSPDVHPEAAGEVRGVRRVVAFLLNQASQGLEAGVHIMRTAVNKRKLNDLATVVPTNRLNGNNQSSPRLARSSPPRPPASPPHSKRQKLEEHTTHTQAQFAIIQDSDGIINRPFPRKRSFDNHSDSQQTSRSQSNHKGAQPTQSIIPEYQGIRKFTGPTPRKRPRYDPCNEMPDKFAFLGSDIDSDGDVQVVEDPKPVATSQKFEQPQKESLQPIQEMARRFGGGHKTTANSIRSTAAAIQLSKIIDKTGQKEAKRKSADSSPDELAPEMRDFRGKVSTKRHVTPSPSLSKRGDIQRTKFSASSHTQGAQETIGEPDLGRARKIIGSRLRIRRAVSGSYKYEAEKASSADECFLKLLDVSFILQPANSDDKLLKQYAYCTINLNKISSISLSSDPDRCIVLINRSTDATISGGPKLLIEFLSPEDFEHFKKWANMDLASVKRRDLIIKTENPDKLEKKLMHMITVAHRSTTITDDEPKGDDIRLIEHNAAVRVSNQVQSSNRSYVSTTQVKLKDSMRSQIPSSISNSKPTVIPDNSRPYDTQRPPRTTRSTFALKSPGLEFESPGVAGWTTKNKGWEKNWRNSLVFPPQGKNRATVDKEDIPRLDEGEFLNDNLLIFYLRYLQHSLEAKRPDLAQRIYFQNTFFYSKLRSSRANQGINYESVKAWTSKVDLFTKDYIIVPINECSHWYVAIIYNAPKLLPSSNKMEASGDSSKDSIIIEEDADDSGRLLSPSPHNKKLSEPMSVEGTASAVQNDVISHLSPIDSEKQKGDVQTDGHKHDIDVVRDMDDSKAEVEQIMSPNDSLQQNKIKKKQSSRKHSPDQPKIITLDSLGIPHSPACICLKQYLIAELKDKKGIEIPNPGSLGMTARHLPEQSNHCDCGLYLLGYIQEFLKDPDAFVRNLLQHHKKIAWDFDPSRLRSEIRDLIFQLQKEQQDREDAEKEEKRKGGLKKKKPGAEHQSPEPNGLPAKEQVTNQGLSESLKEGKEETVFEANETVVAPESKSPTSKVPCPETRHTSDSEESRDTLGAVPRTPVAKSPDTMGPSVMAGGGNGKRMETPRFVSPLPPSTCGSPPTTPMVVDDSETEGQRQDVVHARRGSKPPSSPVVIEDSPQSIKNHKTSVITNRTQEEARVTSHYFAGRHSGDKMARATLHREPVISQNVVDISD